MKNQNIREVEWIFREAQKKARPLQKKSVDKNSLFHPAANRASKVVVVKNTTTNQ